jgi:hypothetical protein
MALAYLPGHEIRPIFRRIRRRIPAANEASQALAAYMEATWVGPTAFFRPEDWTVYGRAIRTNNDVEGWHQRINTRARRHGNCPLYQLLELLAEEVKFVPLQRKLLAQGKLHKRQRQNCKKAYGRPMKLAI